MPPLPTSPWIPLAFPLLIPHMQSHWRRWQATSGGVELPHWRAGWMAASAPLRWPLHSDSPTILLRISTVLEMTQTMVLQVHGATHQWPCLRRAWSRRVENRGWEQWSMTICRGLFAAFTQLPTAGNLQAKPQCRCVHGQNATLVCWGRAMNNLNNIGTQYAVL